MTKSRKSPTGFIVVLPGEIIENPQDNDRSWLTLFYCLPREMAEKYPEALEIPRCPYEVLYKHLPAEGHQTELGWQERISLLQYIFCWYFP